jgi:hypothetical protein
MLRLFGSDGSPPISIGQQTNPTPGILEPYFDYLAGMSHLYIDGRLSNMRLLQHPTIIEQDSYFNILPAETF